MEPIQPNDIAAMDDVVDAAIEQSDDLDLEAAYALRGALAAHFKKVRLAIDMLEMRVAKLLDGQPKIVHTADGNSVALVVKDEGKWRPDQKLIRLKLSSASLYDADGVKLRKMVDVAGRAVDLMYDCFVAPAAMPKQGALDKLGLDKPDIADWVKTGTKLVETKLDG